MKSFLHISLTCCLLVLFSSFQLSASNKSEISKVNHADIKTQKSEKPSLNEHKCTQTENRLEISGIVKSITYKADNKVIIKSSHSIVFKPGTRISAGTELHASIISGSSEIKPDENSVKKIMDIVKQHKKNKNNNLKSKKSSKKKSTEKESKINKRLLFLVTTYEFMCETTDKTYGILDNKSKSKNTYITANHFQGIASEQKNRLVFTNNESLKSLPNNNNALKTNYYIVTSVFKPEVNMVLRL